MLYKKISDIQKRLFEKAHSIRQKEGLVSHECKTYKMSWKEALKKASEQIKKELARTDAPIGRSETTVKPKAKPSAASKKEVDKAPKPQTPTQQAETAKKPTRTITAQQKTARTVKKRAALDSSKTAKAVVTKPTRTIDAQQKTARAIKKRNLVDNQEFKESDYKDDIPMKTALYAYYNISFDAEKRANRAIESYLENLKWMFSFLKQKNKTEIFADFREDYKRKFIAYLNALSKTANTMIVGPANFPTERNRKREESAYKRAKELDNSVDFWKRKATKKEAVTQVNDDKNITTTFDGGKIVENHQINRLQFFFDVPPTETVRNVMKNNAFKYAPSLKSWQRILTNNAKYSAKKVLKELNL